MCNSQVLRWWPLGSIATGFADPGGLDMYTDPLNTEHISKINVMIRMDLPFYAPGSSYLDIIPEVSMDGTKWTPLATKKFTATPGGTMFQGVTFDETEIQRMMRWNFHVELDTAGVALSTFDLTGIARSCV